MHLVNAKHWGYGVSSNLTVYCAKTRLIRITFSYRWLLLPWLIYMMILVVGLSLAAILLIVIPLGAPSDSQNWPVSIGEAGACLAIAGIYLYFWIVALELFIKMGPFYHYDGVIFSQVPPVPIHQVSTRSTWGGAA